MTSLHSLSFVSSKSAQGEDSIIQDFWTPTPSVGPSHRASNVKRSIDLATMAGQVRTNGARAVEDTREFIPTEETNTCSEHDYKLVFPASTTKMCNTLTSHGVHQLVKMKQSSETKHTAIDHIPCYSTVHGNDKVSVATHFGRDEQVLTDREEMGSMPRSFDVIPCMFNLALSHAYEISAPVTDRLHPSHRRVLCRCAIPYPCERTRPARRKSIAIIGYHFRPPYESLLSSPPASKRPPPSSSIRKTCSESVYCIVGDMQYPDTPTACNHLQVSGGQVLGRVFSTQELETFMGRGILVQLMVGLDANAVAYTVSGSTGLESALHVYSKTRQTIDAMQKGIVLPDAWFDSIQRWKKNTVAEHGGG
nr:hypothetical protein CFP56_52827 [Quercus suber]